MAAGGKCEYLLYGASAHALANRLRCAENFLRVLKITPKGRRWSLVDAAHCSSNPQTQQVQGALALFKRQEGHIGTAHHGYHGYKTWFKTELKIGF